MDWLAIEKEIQEIVREHLDDKRTDLQTLVVWDGSTVRELAPWEPMYG